MNVFRLKYFLIALALLILLVLLASGYVYSVLSGSRANYTDDVTGLGLSAPVQVSRDAVGIARISGKNRRDVSQALGFVHAQERYFQMDLLRRSAAGELAELFGGELLPYDKERRVHQFRKRAEQLVQRLTPQEQENLSAYVKGVNQGLAQLDSLPVEYLIIDEEPQEWVAADSLLVAFAMYFDLQDANGSFDRTRGLMQHTLPDSVYAYLTDHESPWRSVMINEAHDYVSFPGPDAFDYVKIPQRPVAYASLPERHLGGSNQWAVRFKENGQYRAILANDMHLGLGVPNLWFRTSLHYVADKNIGTAAEVAVDGVTLPGLPVTIIGSNGHVAWGYTNSQINLDDVFLLETLSDQEYLSHLGPRQFVNEVEYIKVKDAETVAMTVRNTLYGPVLADQHLGQTMAFRWLAHHQDSVNLRHFDFETARDVDDIIALSRRVKMPTMNFMVADHLGNIGWTLIGPVPEPRQGYSGLVPVAVAQLHQAPALDVLPAADYPTLINPDSGRLWSANNQTAQGPVADLHGDGAYVNGSRAQQIEKKLIATSQPTIDKMLAIQLDDEALFLSRWRELLLDMIERHQPEVVSQSLVDALQQWDGRASTDSAAYYIVREFRMAAQTDILNKLFADAIEHWDGFDMISFDYEQAQWRIIQEQVPSLLDAQLTSWDEQLTVYLEHVLQPFTSESKQVDLSQMRWGLHSVAAIQHPFSEAAPFLSSWLDAPAEPMNGDYHMPLIARPSVGASQRMVVRPGDEANAVFHMPGGQSGHVLSPFYLSGHDDWKNGEHSPLLPGAPIYELTLQ